MQRETKTITTPSGLIVEIYSYLTAREANEIKESMYKAMKIDMATGTPIVTDLTGEFMIEQEKKLMRILVKSVAGYEGDKPSEALLDMRDSDYQAVLSEVNNIHKGNLTPA